jgi:hypothetical protein
VVFIEHPQKRHFQFFSTLNALYMYIEIAENQQITRSLFIHSTFCLLDSTASYRSSASRWHWHVSMTIIIIRETINECILVFGNANKAESNEWNMVWKDVTILTRETQSVRFEKRAYRQILCAFNPSPSDIAEWQHVEIISYNTLLRLVLNTSLISR